MNLDLRRHSAAADRNKDAIVRQLQRLLPRSGLLLEIASGTGQHAAHASAALPGWQWQPSDPDPDLLPSISAWCQGVPQALAPLLLDVLDEPWAGVRDTVDAMFCANMIHIAPWPACAALMRGAARHLTAAGLLCLYGPYTVDGEPTAASNLAFDADLRARNPDWGLRRLGDVAAQAKHCGLLLHERVAMPANNLLLVFARGA